MKSEQLLSQEFVKAHSIDAARILEQLPVKETIKFLMEIPSHLAAEVSRLMAPFMVTKFLEDIDPNKAAAIITKFPVEFAAVSLRRVEESKRSAILEMLMDEDRKSLGLLLKYPENRVGALMEPQVFTLFGDISVKEALKHMHKYPKHVFYHIPVIDREHIFLGLIGIRELMLSKPPALITSVMHTGVGQLSPVSNREVILGHPDWKIYYNLPVVDGKGIFLGMISYQIVRRLEDEIQKSTRSMSVYDAGKALGELYWIGMSAFLKGAASFISPNNKLK